MNTSIKISRKKAFFNTFFTSIISFILSGIFSFLFLPFIIKQLGQSTYAILTIIIESLNISFITKAVNDLYSPKITVLHSKKDFYKLNQTYSRYLFFIFLTCIIYIIITGAITFFVIYFKIKNSSELSSLTIAAIIMHLCTVINIINSTYHTLSACFQNPYKFNTAYMIYRNLIFIIILILIKFKFGIYAFPASYLLCTILYTILVLHITKNDKELSTLYYNPDWEAIKLDIKPFLFAIFNASLSIFSNSPAWIISLLFTPKFNLHFKMTQKIYELIQPLYDMYNNSFGIALSHYISTGNNKRTIQYIKLSLSATAALGTLTVFIAYQINYSFLTIWLNSSFFLGKDENLLIAFLALMILLSNAINTVNRYIGNYKLNIKICNIENLSILFLSFLFIKLYNFKVILFSFIGIKICFLCLNIKNLRLINFK